MKTFCMNFVVLTVTGLVLAVAPGPVLASPIDLTLELGGAVPDSGKTTMTVPGTAQRVDGSWETGPVFQAKLMTQARPWLSLGMQFGIAKQNFSSNDPSLTNTDVGTSVSMDRKIVQVTPEVEIGSWLGDNQCQWKPYVSFGGGLYNVTNTATTKLPGAGACTQTCSQSCIDPNDLNSCTQTCTESCDDTLGTASEASGNWGFNAGAGVLLRLGSHVAIGPEVQYHQVSGDNPFHYTTTSFRAAFLF